MWDERYRSHQGPWSGRPNPQLVAEVSDLSPRSSDLGTGRALDVGCGDGTDALWLARRGWLVDAVDFSAEALRRGSAQAEQAGADVADRISWLAEDLTVWRPEHQRYRLVSSQFMHLPPGPRTAMFAGLVSAVALGGILLIVGHHPTDLRSGARRPPVPELFYDGSELVRLLEPKAWQVLVDEARPRSATDPDGHPITVHDTVLSARREFDAP